MNFPRFLRQIIPVVLLALACARSSAAEPSTAPAELHRFRYAEFKMGTAFQLILWTPDQKTADDAAEAAWARVDQLNKTLSDYDPQSELNRLCRLTDSGPMKEPVEVSDDLWRMLLVGAEADRQSGGAFDITVGPLTRLQREERKTHKAPDPERLKDARECVGFHYIKFDPDHHRVQLLHKSMQLDVGGVAKGFTSDEVLKLLRSRGITHALCGAAGDIAMGDPPPGRADWRIAIQSLKSPDQNAEYVQLHNYGISTSGDTYRAAIVDGKEYSHIIDPKTGQGLTHRIGVTTVAPTATTTDWTSTAISILGPEKGIEMIETIPAAAARIETIDEHGNEKIYTSKRFVQFLAPHQSTTAPATQPVK